MDTQLCEQHQQLFSDVQVIKNSLETIKEGIDNSLKWRVAVICTFLGLIGLFINSAIRFGVMESKAVASEVEIREIKTQIYDLNYIKGRTEGLSER